MQVANFTLWLQQLGLGQCTVSEPYDVHVEDVPARVMCLCQLLR